MWTKNDNGRVQSPAKVYGAHISRQMQISALLRRSASTLMYHSVVRKNYYGSKLFIRGYVHRLHRNVAPFFFKYRDS